MSFGEKRASQRCRRAKQLLCSSAPRLSAPLLLGVALFAGYAFQTAGLHLTTPAKAGFITGLSVVIVPLFAALILRQPPSRNAWLGVGLAVVGLAFLTLQPGLQVAPGDLLVLACAFAFAAHILLTGHFAPRYDPLRLTLGSIVTVAILSGAAALIFDRPLDPAALDAQRPVRGRVHRCAGDLGRVRPSDLSATVHHRTHTALIFAAEPVFAGLFSFLLIGEVLGLKQVLGCLLILAGMVVAEMRRGA